jgi:hypothetical protein
VVDYSPKREIVHPTQRGGEFFANIFSPFSWGGGQGDGSYDVDEEIHVRLVQTQANADISLLPGA